MVDSIKQKNKKNARAPLEAGSVINSNVKLLDSYMSRGGSITLLKGILAQRDQTPEKGRSRGICVKNDFHSDYRSRLEWQWQNLALRNGIVTFPMTQCWGFPTRRIFPAWILKTASLHSRIFRFPNTGLPNNFTEMCIGSEAGSYVRRIDFCITHL